MKHEFPNIVRWSLTLLRWFCPAGLRESIEGDCLEAYQGDLKRNAATASIRCFFRVCSFFKSGILLRHLINANDFVALGALIQSGLVVSLRSLTRYKINALINISGLGASLTVALLIIIVIDHKLSYDNFHREADHIYRVTTRQTNNSATDHFATTPKKLSEELLRTTEGVQVATVSPVRSLLIIRGEELSVACALVSKSFFDFFSFDLLGGAKSSIGSPRSACISQSLAKTVFGSESPLGQTISLSEGDFIINGIFSEPGEPTQFKFDVLVGSNESSFEDQTVKNALALDTYTFVKLGHGQSPEKFETVLSTLLETNSQKQHRSTFHLQSLKSLAMSELQSELPHGLSNLVLTLFAVLAAIVITLALFNYCNLTAIDTLKRSREIAIRKVHGARQIHIVLQRIIDGVVISVISTLLAFLAVRSFPLSPAMKRSMPTDLPVSIFIWSSALALIVGVIAGLMPAAILSGTNIVKSLKGWIKSESRISFFQKFTLSAQFACAITIVLVLLLSLRQMSFQINTDYGFKRTDLIQLPVKDISPEVLAEKIKAQAGVESVSLSSSPIFSFADSFLARRGDSCWVEFYAADQKFVGTNELVLVAGSDLNEGGGNNQLLLNETAAKELGFNDVQDAVGEVILDRTMQLQIVGVLRDFHAHPMKHRIAPFGIRMLRSGEAKYITVKTFPGQHRKVIEEIKPIWKSLTNMSSDIIDFESEFANRQFHGDEMNMIGAFTVIVLVISLLGLLGIAANHVEARTKEIGIRRVMGASVKGIILIMCRSFGRLLISASIIGLPIGLWVTNNMFSRFAYKAGGTMMTVLCGFAALLMLAIAIISTQALRVTAKNPVETLRHD